MSDTKEKSSALSVEEQGIDTIAESDRHGSPKDLFWPWFAANISVLAMSYGAWSLGFGISFWQATLASIIGIVVSFLLVGVVSIAGKRANAPTMVITRATFGVEGAKVPSVLSWIATLGWEISLTTTAVLALASTFQRLGWGSGAAPKIISTVIVVGLVVVAGIFGYDLIMKAQQAITVISGVVTIGFLILGWSHIDFAAVGASQGGSAPAVLGACLFVMTGFGLGWVNVAADYSRYLPRKSSNTGIVFWSTFGASLAPVLLVIYGGLLAVSNKDLADAVGNDPIGAMASILPTWYLVPFTIVAVLGLMSGAIMDNYSNGLALLSFGIKLPRVAAAGLTAALTVLGVVYVTFFSDTFIGPFQGFLITLGVPMAVWTGLFIADVLLRRKDYATDDLYKPSGRYGAWNVKSLVILVVGTLLGWGLVVNTSASWLEWQGYFLGFFGGKDGAWASANLGVIVALLVGLLGALIFQRGDIAAQEKEN
ncbi:purine-cytosine permease family protein [Bifidobacterium miconisargentati]|uniref:purine-cytosine permease family protein n=1 Tax=Bifidobacterium miconisargentati TaxID=2834437 RepID=UPI001BDBE308|nr:cytosine permease [Bifidobacterium miconisargentati]MBW3089797.1 cytosine permease [Bifidobacterium miconisargentati]